MITVDKKLMDYLSRRSYSELELREKLLPLYPADDVEQALANARARGWLEKPEEQTAKIAEELGRRGKGDAYIQDYLRKKGLPSVERDKDAEVQKARLLVARHLRLEPPYPKDQHIAIYRLLKNRGYDYDVARSVANLTAT